MSTAWLSSSEIDNERDGPTVGAMSTAWLSSPEIDNERDGPTVGAMSSAWLSSGAGLSVTSDGRYSTLLKMYRSNGHTPDTLKPAMTFFGVAAFVNAVPASSDI